MTFNSFMRANAKDKEILERPISNRFIQLDEDGNPILDSEGNEKPVLFKFKGVSQNKADSLRKQSRISKLDGKIVKSDDQNERYTKLLVIETMISPNMKDRALQEDYGRLGDPEGLLGDMFTQGEYLDIVDAVLDANDLGDIVDEYKEAKN